MGLGVVLGCSFCRSPFFEAVEIVIKGSEVTLPHVLGGGLDNGL
jgi:hypothetical protein